MDIFSWSTFYLAIADFIVCFIAILLLRNNDRFWLPCVVIWMLLFFTLVMGHVFNTEEVDYLQVMHDSQMKTPDNVTPTKNDVKAAISQRNRFTGKMTNLLGVHSIMSFFWMLLGYHQTKEIRYRKALYSFGIVSIIYIIILVIKMV